MTTDLFASLILTFLAPILYQRLHFVLKRQDFYVTPLRTLTGLQIHHGHWGLLFMIGSGVWFVFGNRQSESTYRTASFVFVYGLGLLVDEIIPSLKMPSKGRDMELSVYGSTTAPTALLVAVMMLLMFAVFAMR